MGNHTTLVTHHAISNITHHSPLLTPIDRLTQRIQQRGDTLRLAPSKCRNCLVCRREEYNRKSDMRRRRSLSRVKMARPYLITISPENPAHPKIGSLIGQAIKRLQRSGLCTDTYVWQAEVGRQNGRLHVHALIDATASVAEVRAALDAWHDNRKEQFCSKHSGIHVESYGVLAEAIEYVFKTDAAPVDAEGWERLPRRTFDASRDIDLKPRKQRHVAESAKRRSPNDYAPRTWDSHDCGKFVEAATMKQDTFLISDSVRLDLAWPEFLALCGEPDGKEKLTLQDNDAQQMLQYLAYHAEMSDQQQSTEMQPLPSPYDPNSWLDRNVPVQSV